MKETIKSDRLRLKIVKYCVWKFIIKKHHYSADIHIRPIKELYGNLITNPIVIPAIYWVVQNNDTKLRRCKDKPILKLLWLKFDDFL